MLTSAVCHIHFFWSPGFILLLVKKDVDFVAFSDHNPIHLLEEGVTIPTATFASAKFKLRLSALE